MGNADLRIGANVNMLRGDMSQAALASAMREMGWKWTQPTVAAIEKGERPLKLAEAVQLSQILGADLQQFIWSDEAIEDERRAIAIQRNADRLAEALGTALSRQLEACVSADQRGLTLPKTEYWMGIRSAGELLQESLSDVLLAARTSPHGPMLDAAREIWSREYKRLSGVSWENRYPIAKPDGTPADAAE